MRSVVLVLLVSVAGCDKLLSLDQVKPLPDALVSPDVMLVCPADYIMSNGTDSQYRLAATPVDFVTAARDCADDEISGPPILHHTHLAVLSDASELDYLHTYGFGWVGLTDVTSPTNVWSWVTDELSLSPAAGDTAVWAPTEPNNLMTEHCGHFDSGHQPFVNNVPCASPELHVYVCECDTHANRPAVYGD